jgi:hypothetical protein
MTYRNTLIERSRQFESENDEPAVLDYLQLRNRQCLYAWRMKRVEQALASARLPGSLSLPTASAEYLRTTRS